MIISRITIELYVHVLATLYLLESDEYSPVHLLGFQLLQLVWPVTCEEKVTKENPKSLARIKAV